MLAVVIIVTAVAILSLAVWRLRTRAPSGLRPVAPQDATWLQDSLVSAGSRLAS